MTSRSVQVAILIGIFCGLGIALRFTNLSDVYTEYDDVGVIALHHSQASPDSRRYSILQSDFLRLELTTKPSALRALLDTSFFGAYISKVWTYPPGQYLLYPLVIDESESFQTRLTKGRAFSAIFSSLALLGFVALLALLNGNQFAASMLIPIGIFAFSLNSTLYAHHMSPYSLTVLTTVVSLLLPVLALRHKISLTAALTGLGLLAWFNYLALLLLPPLLCSLAFDSFALPRREKLLKFIQEAIPGLLVFLISFTPLAILFFKPNAGIRGSMPPTDSLWNYLLYFSQKFFIALGSALASVSTDRFLNAILAAGLFLFSAGVLAYRRRELAPAKLVVTIFGAVFFSEWLLLHAAGKMIMESSRHVLLWLPIFLAILWVALEEVKIAVWINCLLAVLIAALGWVNNLAALNARQSHFDYHFLEKKPERVIITYAGTLGPLAYFSNRPDWKVYLDASGTFSEHYASLKLPTRLLLVSQTMPLSAYPVSGYADYYRKNQRLFEEYQTRTLIERGSSTHFNYDDTPVSSSPNGFFVYELIRKPAGGANVVIR